MKVLYGGGLFHEKPGDARAHHVYRYTQRYHEYQEQDEQKERLARPRFLVQHGRRRIKNDGLIVEIVDERAGAIEHVGMHI